MKPHEAADQIGKLADLLLDPVDSQIELADLIEMVDRLDEAARNIRSASTAAKALANRLIDNAGEMNGFLKAQTGLLETPLAVENGAVTLPPGIPRLKSADALSALAVDSARFGAQGRS